LVGKAIRGTELGALASLPTPSFMFASLDNQAVTKCVWIQSKSTCFIKLQVAGEGEETLYKAKKISNTQFLISNEMPEKTKRVFDLEERTASFGEAVIDFTKKLQKNEISRPLITQLVRSATSVGANYCEADCAESRKDFEHKLGIAKKEAKETKHWLRMLARALPEHADQAKVLWKEANELQLIFISIVRKSRENGSK